MSVFDDVRGIECREAAERYGLAVSRSGMASCPFHEDRHPSMKVDRRFHCFSCGADGDAVDLTARLIDLGKRDAAVKLAQDFGISVTETKYNGKKAAATKQDWESCIRFINDLTSCRELLKSVVKTDKKDPGCGAAEDRVRTAEHNIEVVDALLKRMMTPDTAAAAAIAAENRDTVKDIIRLLG